MKSDTSPSNLSVTGASEIRRYIIGSAMLAYEHLQAEQINPIPKENSHLRKAGIKLCKSIIDAGKQYASRARSDGKAAKKISIAIQFKFLEAAFRKLQDGSLKIENLPTSIDAFFKDEEYKNNFPTLNSLDFKPYFSLSSFNLKTLIPKDYKEVSSLGGPTKAARELLAEVHGCTAKVVKSYYDDLADDMCNEMHLSRKYIMSLLTDPSPSIQQFQLNVIDQMITDLEKIRDKWQDK